MKKLNDVLFSMLSSVVLLTIFAIGIAYATFIESNESTEMARELVYNAFWFEALLFLLIINLIGSIVRYEILNIRKFSILLFHIAFIIILVGAGITRYFGSEGIMHIREGETSNEISSQISSVKIIAEFNGQKVEKNEEVKLGQTETNEFSQKLEIAGKTITVETELFLPNAIESLEADEQGEPGFIIFVMNENNQGQEIILMDGESSESYNLIFAFSDSTVKADINFTMDGEQLLMQANTPVVKMSMMQGTESIIPIGTFTPAEVKTIYKSEHLVFVLKKFLPNSVKSLTQSMPDLNKMSVMVQPKNALIFNVSDGNVSKKLNVLVGENEISDIGTCLLNDIKVSVVYGNLPQVLPFSITLRDFQLDRYPGSNSPSSYASEITLTDNETKKVTPFRIYMNNILNYRGYRFFQSSYDNDEQGTILSVNKDYWGTMITYFGYLLMLIGMVLTLFNKNSRFYTVIKLSNEMQKKRKLAKMLVLVGFMASSVSISATTNNSKESHIKALSSLLIQDGAQGRVEPISTYASDLIRKISKKTTYKSQSSLEVLLGMCTNPEYWQNEPIIKIAHEGLAKELGAEKDFVSFTQLFDMKNEGLYRLADKVDAIYQKDPSMRNQYEKEIINVDERVNIVNAIFNGNMLTIFPVSGHDTDKWISAVDFTHHSENEMDMTGDLMSESDLKPAMGKEKMLSKENSMMSGISAAMSEPKAINPENLINSYFSAVVQAEKTGNWTDANNVLLSLKNYQQINGGSQLPDKNRVKLEVIYNNLSIFLTLAILYGLIGIILIKMHVFNILKFNPKIDKYLDKSIYPLAFMFLVYTAGLALRWYISGHAPWSNGYEAMIFVGWGTALAGLVFAGQNPITLAITSLLAAIALSVAGMSWMNPEITNLVPVLKSYWLVVHVAVITSSYGFLATAAMLSFFNLCLMIARTTKNAMKINDNIQEFSYIIELSLIIGLFMLTVGTFLGGVWANESWGRYWGWDSKETWALVSILVYSIILHLRKISKTNNLLVFNTAAMIAFSSVIMTFLGVNYYLSGMHSYGQGTPPPIPTVLYLIIIGIILLIYFAYKNEQKINKL